MPVTTSILPNFIVVGANKGGTTSIYHYLRQHPEVYLSPVKEPHFFQKISISIYLNGNSPKINYRISKNM